VSDVFLGIIAVAVLVMAVVQVAVIVIAARAARQVGAALSRFEQSVQPIISNLQTVSTDAARASAAATAQVERAGQVLQDLAARVDETVMSLQETILRPAREGLAFLESLRSIFAAFRSGDRSASRRPAAAEEEDALFIG
jgi:hypothetical protein